ncbi:unnamed protein product [Ceratitis capitata]|uniref:(Mediterranean fruit fly) hypothetical protein n=1 Tax=Ceratitis capitata TaxID=7213 RepID=A0A811V316_CERCA|nr:unnamed protein product [Ceratitis capitata]
MDILDIDEALKDDSFICLEDKTHDDVSNILQQWKSNNCQLPPQYQQEQAYKLNSKTFTRPRKKSAQNLEQHFAHLPGVNNAVHSTLPFQQEQFQPKFTIASPQPQAFNMEIGGLVTTMHKSFLQDTSPPSSICSSMEVSMERMNNSLITSADFTNINFLQSTQSIDFNEPTLNGGEMFNLANKATSDGYTLSDMIRDRKALESLTMSGDGTLIKDSHIGQIDDISLALSKTASGYSTMDNSTESMQEEQQLLQRNGVQASATNTTVFVPQNKCNIMDRTILLSDEVISDTTFDLVESSLCESSINGNDIATLAATAKLCNETFKRPWPMDETVCIPNKANATFEFKQLTPDARLATEVRCETPENVAATLGSRKFYESTPHTSSWNKSAQQNTPTTSKLTVDEVNISPIVGETDKQRAFDDSFGQGSDVKKVNSKTYSGTLPRLESIEQMLDDIENPNETFDKIGGRTQVLQQSAADIQMQNVLELAHAEEELLASNNDQEFEHMLEEFSKVEVNAEHVKMKKSLETIKRRFNRDTVTLSKTPHLHQGFGSDQEIADLSEKPIEANPSDTNDQRRNGSYIKTELSAYKLNESSALSGLSSPSPSSASTSSAATSMVGSGSVVGGNATTSSERLLSRRSRLYDNINLSTISSANTQSPTSSLGASYTVHNREDNEYECSAKTVADKHETECNNDGKQMNNFEKTEEESENIHPPTIKNDYSGIGTYKLSERRDRDRDRFKTIKIVKGRSANDGLVAVSVPCIDDDISTECPEVFDNNKSEIENMYDDMRPASGSQNGVTKPTAASKINPNFLTYKKPRDKPKLVGNLPEIDTTPEVASASSGELEKMPEPPSRLRSRSRPRYISGLQKMTVVKATSAGDLDRATAPGIRPPNASVSHVALNSCQDVKATIAAASNKYNRTQPLKASTEEVKSPMGTKSKSFHNLSSNFGFNGSANNLSGMRVNSIGLKKPNGYEIGGVTTTNAAKDRIGNGISNAAPSQPDDAVFKVPKLVSGLRAPGVKRAGLVRPSSGYYSLNSLAVKGMPPLPQPPLVNDVDSDGGRHSPTDSMSSASSRGSIQNSSGSSGNVGKCSAKSATNANTLNLTKITTGSTGIPKPSGLRPPTTNIKRSGLPKPAMATARR